MKTKHGLFQAHKLWAGFAVRATLCVAILAAIFTFTGCPTDSDTDPDPNPSPSGKTLSSISVTTQPTKTTYTVGETLATAGLTVKAYYTDSTDAEVTTFTTDPANGAALNTAGTQTVTVSYTEGDVTKTTTFSVTVNATLETITKQSFAGTWGSIPSVNYFGYEAVISSVNDTGATLVFTGKSNIGSSSFPNYVTYSTTLTLTWGAAATFDVGNVNDATGYEITGTLSGATGSWSSSVGSDARAVFGSNGTTLGSSLKIGIWQAVGTDGQLAKSLYIQHGTGTYDRLNIGSLQTGN